MEICKSSVHHFEEQFDDDFGLKESRKILEGKFFCGFWMEYGYKLSLESKLKL